MLRRGLITDLGIALGKYSLLEFGDGDDPSRGMDCAESYDAGELILDIGLGFAMGNFFWYAGHN